MSLGPAKAEFVARPFDVMTSNVPGDYPPDQWADIVTSRLISVDDDASESRKRKVAAFKAKAREILINAFSNVQEGEQYLLAEQGADRYDADPGIDWHVNDAADRIIQAAHDELVIDGIDLGDWYARNRYFVCNAIGTNLATSVSITRRWHAHAHEDDPRARKFLALH
jgi:hypothetical protein